MTILNCEIPASVNKELVDQSRLTGESLQSLVTKALCRYFRVPLHTLFQISTSGALVQGIYEGAVSSNFLLNYGNFGLGTFEHLDGEMVIVDGVVFQVRADGTVRQVQEDSRTPFAVVVDFVPDQEQIIEKLETFEALSKACDQYRDTNNVFYAFRIDGRFSCIHTRAMRATLVGLPLASAAAQQPEFTFREIEGTLIGIWSPQFSSALNVPGYHFHFLSADRSKGGHLLACSGEKLRLQVERLNDFHISLPESEEF